MMKNRHAFTLIELLIVVAIIGILAAIAVPRFQDAQIRAKMAHGRVSLSTLKTGVHALVLDKGVMLVDEADYETDDGKNRIRNYFNSVGLSGTSFSEGHCPVFAPLTTPVPYLSSLPKDPFGMRVNESYSGSHTFVLFILPSTAGCMGTFDYWDNDPKIHHPSEPDYKLNTLTYGSLKENEFIILFGGPIAGRPAVYQPSNGVISDGWIYVRSKV